MPHLAVDEEGRSSLLYPSIFPLLRCDIYTYLSGPISFSCYLFPSYLILTCHILYKRMLSHIVFSHPILSHLISSHLILFYLIYFIYVSSCHILPYLTASDIFNFTVLIYSGLFCSTPNSPHSNADDGIGAADAPTRALNDVPVRLIVIIIINYVPFFLYDVSVRLLASSIMFCIYPTRTE